VQKPRFFKSSSDVNSWFEKNHDKADEIVVGFYSVKSGKKGAGYKVVLDEALCFGWIDGIRKNVDEESYSIRFTPRKKKSIWSNVNTKRMEELIEEGRAHQAGIAAFKQREEKRAGIYSFEQKEHKLSPAFEKKFRSKKKAWNYFASTAPWYQRTCIHWVMSAKQEATRIKRLDTLIDDSANERTVAHLTRNPKT
jgi:uncharacterized protein YdeI (YjbR/CyaY-like superfamily)